MTEIPEYLRERAERARRRAKGLPVDKMAPVAHLLKVTPKDAPAPETNPHDAYDWRRFGNKPMVVARRVLEVVRGDSEREVKAFVASDTDDDTKKYILHETRTREVSSELRVQLGAISIVELPESAAVQTLDAVRNFARDIIADRPTQGAKSVREVDPRTFLLAQASGEVTGQYALPWSELVVSAMGQSMLTGFSMLVANHPNARSATHERWGSSAQVVHPIDTPEGIEHVGYFTLQAVDYTSPAAYQTSGALARQTLRERIDGDLDLRLANSNPTAPTVTGTVEAAMHGLEVSTTLMTDQFASGKLAEYNGQLQAALAELARA